MEFESVFFFPDFLFLRLKSFALLLIDVTVSFFPVYLSDLLPALSSQDWNSWETARWACEMAPKALCSVPSAAVLKVDVIGFYSSMAWSIGGVIT